MSVRFKYYILLFLCMLPNIAWAQNDVDPLGPYSAGAARKAQLESAWSLSGSIDSLKKVDDTGGWHTKVINAKVQIKKIREGLTFTSDGRASVKRTLKKGTNPRTGTHIKTNPSFMKWKRAQIQQAQLEAKRREEKRRLERIKNMTAQAAQYNANMSAWRMQNNNSVVDNLEELKQVSAMDYASIPQGTAGPKINSMSNQNMAALLKNDIDDKSDVEVVFIEPNEERENKHKTSIAPNERYIDLYDDGGYNNNDLELWEKALTSEKPTVHTDNANAQIYTQQYEATVLSKKEWIDLDSFNISTLPYIGCVALIGDSILLLDNDSLPFLQWSVTSNVSQVIACGEKTIGKRDNQIVEVKKDGVELICELENENFNIYPETDSTFIVNANFTSLFIVIRINIITMIYDELLRTPTTIRKVVSNGKVTLSLLKKHIIDISELPKLFYLSETYINDICMCREGLLVATDNKVFLLVSPQEIYTLTDEGASKLWCDGADIYMINKQGDLIRYSKTQKNQ